jgi:RNA recognition motif-containing protein
MVGHQPVFRGAFRNPNHGNNLGWDLSSTGLLLMNTKLFVGNLSFDTTENDLQDAFAAHGSVVEVNILQDRMTNKPRGFGFVTMSSKQEADSAITAMNGTDMNGRALTVNEARPREERAGGGGGGRGFGGGGGGNRSYNRSRY